ncbi:hypothetical protein ACIPRL_07860 [Streptomyces sp. NPDC090085]|uniref:hypothetical protein n=1 Tax=Streptomyces sp. NPDC090085 TaxID=3365943 RepID=UPI003813CCC8
MNTDRVPAEVCGVCAHPRGRDVLLDVAAGLVTVAGAAVRLHVGPGQVRRHLDVCAPGGVFDEDQAADEGPVIRPENIQRHLVEAIGHASDIVRGHGVERTSATTTIKALAELRGLLELGARMTGAVGPGAGTTVNVSGVAGIVQGPEWAQLTAWADANLTPGSGDRKALAERLADMPLELDLQPERGTR